MSTFERARKNILKDIASTRVHDGMSWANILLKNTSRLTNMEDQKKFWDFLCNPDDNEYLPKCEVMSYEHKEPECPDSYTIGDIEMKSDYAVDGHAMFVRTGPSEAIDKSVKLLTGQHELSLDSDDEKSPETS